MQFGMPTMIETRSIDPAPQSVMSWDLILLNSI